MRKLVIALVAVVLLGGIGALLVISKTNLTSEPNVFTPSEPDCVVDGTPRNLVECIRNEDIHRNGSFGGLRPELNGMTSELLETQENIEPMLLEALLDEGRFAAAHVLLTYRSHSKFGEEREAWNGLRVILFADGHISYEGDDLAKLHKHWEEALRR